MKAKSWLSSGTTWASAFNLTKATLGAGVLTLSSHTMTTGIPIMVALLFGLAIVTYKSVKFLSQACDHTGVFSYDDMAGRLFGTPYAIFLGVAMFINCFGASIVYIIAIGEAIHVVFEWDPKLSSTLVACCLLMPLGCVYEINKLRYFSFAGVVGVALLSLATVYSLCILKVDASLIQSPDKLWKPNSELGFINAISSVTFAYANQFNVPHIYEELNERSVGKMSRVAMRSLLMSVVLYMTAAICGFLVFSDKLEETHSLLKSFRPMVNQGHIFIIIALVGCTVSVSVAHPLHILPMRQSIEYLMSKRDIKWKGSRVLAVISGVILVGATLGCALVYPELTKIIDLVGASAGSIICYISPAAFALKIAKDNNESLLQVKFIFHHLMLAGGILAAIIGTSVAVVSMTRDT